MLTSSEFDMNSEPERSMSIVDMDPWTSFANMIPRHARSRVMMLPTGSIVWRPATDIFETDEAVYIHIDLPGVSKSEIKIDLQSPTGYGTDKTSERESSRSSQEESPRRSGQLFGSRRWHAPAIIVHGHHSGNEPFESATNRLRERHIGRFRKVVYLPSECMWDEREGIKAEFVDGLLKIMIPKRTRTAEQSDEEGVRHVRKVIRVE